MIVYIANPLYDAAFKRIMEEERIAKTFLSTILQREVVSIKICQDGFRNIKSKCITCSIETFFTFTQHKLGHIHTILEGSFLDILDGGRNN